MEPISTPPRAYSAAHFGLTIDGFDELGLFRSIEGGGMKIDVMTYQTGGSPGLTRQPGKAKFEEFKVQCGMAMCRPFYNWLQEFFTGTCGRRSGELLAADFQYNVRARRQFTNALITEVTMPKLDAGDKGAANLTVSIAPDEMQFQKPDGKKLRVPQRTLEQKLWASCNFEFTISGYETVTDQASKVDSFTVKQKTVDYHVGALRSPFKHPGRIELPNLTFYVPEAHAYPLLERVQKASKTGNKETKPLQGSLVTLSNERTPVFHIDFTGGEIASASIDKSDAGSEDIKQVKFEMAIQSLKFSHVDIDTQAEEFNAKFSE
jgi:phage tail-like protein